MIPLKLLAASMILLFPLGSCSNETSCAASCGDVPMRYPFRLESDPAHCGSPGLQFVCLHNQLVLEVDNETIYAVKSIAYENMTLRVVDPGLNRANCSSLPAYNFTSLEPYSLPAQQTMFFFNCSEPMDSPVFIDGSSCFKGSSSHIYMFQGNVSSLRNSCDIVAMVPAVVEAIQNHKYPEIHMKLSLGIQLSWGKYFCQICEGEGGYCSAGQCHCRRALESLPCSWLFLKNKLRKYWKLIVHVVGYSLLLRTSITVLFLTGLAIYKRSKRAEMDEYIREFLRDYQHLKPTRFSYSQIKKMTDKFNQQLGQGGFGSVFKGNLSNGQPVAVKILKDSQGNGQDFINEVATIGRIHHVNVVRLIGFCIQGSKKALVYEYMPNGSLDKYLFSQSNICHLSWNYSYKIALAIARGIEYLHRGCDVRILHFDIKPHNILLDDNYVPKISDFGLAKLCPRDDSVASLTNARGTIGYMAPEMFYKNVGAVSYKSDVYSFGMLLMEMAGRRKNLSLMVQRPSQIYLPTWVYQQLKQRGEVGMEEMGAKEKEIGKRMLITALWCIQLKPADRPSMTRVVEMLENGSENLQIPPPPAMATDWDASPSDRLVTSTD